MNLILLNNLLGGQGLNSRLNMSLREKHGYAYNVESTYTPYIDTGVLTIYFGTDPEKLDKSISLVHKELNLLRTQKLGTLQLRRAKNQILGQIAMSTDNKENLLFTLGKSIMLFNRFDSMETIAQKIEEITADQLIETANEVLASDKLSMLIFK
jgi:predicted Zn-dependent peptidase